jgi:hypothetical protein
VAGLRGRCLFVKTSETQAVVGAQPITFHQVTNILSCPRDLRVGAKGQVRWELRLGWGWTSHLRAPNMLGTVGQAHLWYATSETPVQSTQWAPNNAHWRMAGSGPDGVANTWVGRCNACRVSPLLHRAGSIKADFP